ncbi:MAG: hypothetical protein HWD92_02480 [Flavobacteriia bacterium]|nr:hypothetical protein [Flavobacteriia bacterium]
METFKRRNSVGVLLAAFLVMSTNGLLAQPDLFISSDDTITALPGTILHVTDAIEGDGYVELKADASSYAQISQTNNVVNTGNLILGKRLSSTTAGWRQTAFPFTGSYADLNFNSTLTYVNSSNDGGIASRHNFYGWNSDDAGLDSAVGWESITPATALPSSAAVYMENNGFHDFSQDLRISGTPANGDFTFTLKYTIDPAFGFGVVTDATGWNFIPNPYPSNISISRLFNASGFPSYEAIHVWDADVQQYVAVIPSGVATNYNTSTNDNSTTHIPPLQGFWVKADAIGNTLTLTNAIREVDGNATSFMKAEPELLRLNLVQSSGGVDQMVVYFHNNATPSFDPGLEALKRNGDASNPQIAALDGNREVTITALPYGDHSVSLHVEVPNPGQAYTFELNTDEFDPWSVVELKDLTTGIVYDLRANQPTIQLASGVYANRFVLHINKSGISVEEYLQEVSLAAWQNANGELIIRTGESGRTNLVQLNGQVIYSFSATEGEEHVVSESLPVGVYLIECENPSTSPIKFIIQ